MEERKYVGIWIRVSTEDQAKGESPEHHEKRARLYAEAKGWEVREVYHLEAVSGKSVMQHPEAKRMLQDIKDKTITGLVFSKLARLARNTRELLDFADIFKANDADLVSLQEAIDTSSPAGRLFYTMIAAMAQWEREEISSRVAASVPIRAKLGKSLGGVPPLGYKWEEGKFVINEQEAPIRKLVYELYLQLKRKKAVAKELNEQGYRTREGGKFYDTTIERILRNTTAKGERRANYSTSDGKMKPESEWVFHPCPAIISEELWNEANRLLDEQGKPHKRVGPRPVHLLTGFVQCTCGKKMYIRHEIKYECRKCGRSIQESDLNEIYHEQLKTFLLSEMDIVEYERENDEKVQQKEKLLDIMISENNSLRKEMAELVSMRSKREMEPAAFAEHYKPLEERWRQINDKLPEMQAEVDFLKIQYLSSDTVLHGAKDLYSRWTSLTFEDKRTIVEVITNKITIDKEDITISLAYLPSASQNAGKKQQVVRGRGEVKEKQKIKVNEPTINSRNRRWRGWLFRGYCSC